MNRAIRPLVAVTALLTIQLAASARQGPPPVVNPPIPRTGITVSMAEFMGVGVTASQAFTRAVNAARQRQAARLVVPPGVYRIDDPTPHFHLAVTDVQDLVVDGQGAEFVFTQPVNGFLVANVLRVVIRNLVVDWDLRIASPGVVQRESDGATTIRVDDAYPIDASTPVQAVTRFTHATRSWAKALPEVYYPANLTLRRPQTLQSPSFASFAPGTEVIVRHRIYEGAAFYTGLNATDISYEDITVHSSPGMAFIFWASERGLRVARCRIERRPLPDRLISVGSDGIHIAGTRGDIIIEDNDFSGQGDDSLNIHGLFLHVTAISANTVTLNRASHGLVQVGDVLRFVRRTDLAERGRATVTHVNSTSGPDYLVTLAAAPPTGLVVGDLAANVTRNSARFLVRGNTFHDHRARGILVQAPQGLVENNVIRDVTMQGLHLTSDANFFFESTGLDDVVVRGNTISGVGYGSWEVYERGPHMAAISLIGDVASGISSYPVHRNVRIEANTIVDTPGLAVLVGSADGVTVQDNRIVRSNQVPFSVLRSGAAIDATASGSIMVTRAANVVVQRNHEVIAAGRPDHGVFVDPRNTAGVVVRDNTRQFGPSLSVTGQVATSRGVAVTTPVLVSDVDSPSNGLSLAATSSNTALLPASGIAFSGTGWDRRLTLTPAAGQTGSTAVSVTVNDGHETFSRTLTLTVVDGSLLSGQVLGQAVRLEWTHAQTAGLQGSVLEAGSGAGATSVSLPMGTATSFEATVPSGVYYVRVRAMVNGALAPPSNEITLHVGAAGVPGAPGNLLANVSGGQVQLAWHNATIGGLRTAVRLEATTSQGQQVSIALPSTAETFSTTAPPGTYLVRVRALGPALASDASGDVQVAVPASCAVPATPRSLSATAVGGVVSVTWSLGDPGTAAPDLFVLEAGQNPGTTFVSLPIAARAFRGAAPTGTYYVRVRAVSTCGSSAPTEDVRLSVP